MPLPLHLLSTIVVNLLHERAALVRLLVGFESTVAEVAIVFYQFLKLALSGGDEMRTNL